MRGKHQRAQLRRRNEALAAELDRLRGEIEAETRRLAATQQGAAQTRVARHRLTREEATNINRLQPQEEATGHLAASTARGWSAITDALQELRAVNEQLSRFAGDATIHQIAQAGLKMRLADVHRSAGQPFRGIWYHKKTGGQLPETRDVHLDGWVPDGTPTNPQALAPFATSTVHDTTPDACWVWAVPPWMRPPTDSSDAPALRRQLGATVAGTPTLASEAFPGGPPRREAVITTPWRHAPTVAQPVDAADLAYWYRRNAWSQQWLPDANPVPFWLPAEHSVSYPQAGPLPDGTTLRLPYPLVFAAFAEPWRIEPRSDPVPAAIDAVQALMFYARGRAAAGNPEPLPAVLARLQATGITDRDALPTPLEVLDAFGGVVEGLFLTTDPDGIPGDDIAWCLAINHPCGLPLGRVAVPASRAHSGWRTQIDNIIAGIALSCWHQPTGMATGLGHPSNGEDDPDTNSEADAIVHVLDIDITSPQSTTRGPSEETVSNGRSPRPHLRRGHWRRQSATAPPDRVRWVWVRPTTVNGTNVNVNQVYVLPRG